MSIKQANPRKPKLSTNKQRLTALINKLALNVEEYVELRKLAPGIDRQLNLDENVQQTNELINDAAGYGIDRKLLERLLKGPSQLQDLFLSESDREGLDHAEDPRQFASDLDDVAMEIMELLAETAKKKKERDEEHKIMGSWAAVRSGGAIPDSVVDELTARLIDLCSDDGREEPIPYALAALVRFRLRPEGKSARQTDSKRPDAETLAVLIVAENPTVSDREVAKAVGTAHTTVQRWRRAHRFKARVKAAPRVQNIGKLKLS